MKTKLCIVCGMPQQPSLFISNKNICDLCIENAFINDIDLSNYIDNSEKILKEVRKQRDRDTHAAWRANNPEKIRKIRQRADSKYYGTEKHVVNIKRRRNREQSTKHGIVSLKAILQQYGLFCHICQNPIDDENQLTYDHTIPLARGGTHTMENIRPSHRSCNAWKCDRLQEELIGLTPPQPRQIDDWKVRRQEKANQLRSEAMKQSWQEKDWTERNEKVSQSMLGNTNGSFTKGILKGPMSEENKKKISDANKGKLKKPDINMELMINLYKSGTGIIAIGRELKIDKMTVKKRLIAAGIYIMSNQPK